MPALAFDEVYLQPLKFYVSQSVIAATSLTENNNYASVLTGDKPAKESESFRGYNLKRNKWMSKKRNQVEHPQKFV